VDHDVSLLIPEILCRMTPAERDPQFLINGGFLERCLDFEFSGSQVLGSRLGYRITRAFVRNFFGRVFNHPHLVFTDKMLRPETQDPDLFAEGMENIVATQKRVAEHYFNDGGVRQACPPLQALLHIMAHGQFEGKDLNAPEIRALFTREHLLGSAWYRQRLESKRDSDAALCRRHIKYLEAFLARANYADEAGRLGIRPRLEACRQRLAEVQSPGYLEALTGTIGREPLAVAS
jgi:hypothetical protein